jgi:hypothetical protein
VSDRESPRLTPVNGLLMARRPLRPEANAQCGLPPPLFGLTCLAASVDVRWRPLVCVAIVTHLVTHSSRLLSGRIAPELAWQRFGSGAPGMPLKASTFQVRRLS